MASLALAFDILARDKASRVFDKVGDSADKAGKKGGEFGKKMGSGISSMTKGLLGLAAGAGFGFGAMISEAKESAKIGRLTEAVVKSTGGAAKISAEQVGSLAEAISNKTAVDDEAIQSGANLLLTFTKVRNETGKGNDIFNQAVEAANNMSAALGTDMKGASLQLGKALNDPIKGVTALGRAGVSFTKQQKEQIKTLVESGDTLGAQKIILGEMQKQFVGAAEAAADPLQRLQVIAGNLGEKVGGVLLPYIERFANFVADKVVPAVVRFIDEFEGGVGMGGQFRDILAQVIDKAKGVATFIRENATVIGGLVAVIGTAVAIIKTISAVTKAYTIVQIALNVALTANPIGIIVVAIGALVAAIIWVATQTTFFQDTWKAMTEGISKAWRWLWNTIIAPIIRWILNGFASMTSGIASFLRALSNIPGFGWAKDAADKMDNAADKARGMARGIQDIPDEKQVTISIRAKATDTAVRALNLTSSGSTSKAQALIGMEAREFGGPVVKGRPYIVGEKRPEIFVPDQNGHIQPFVPTMGGGSGRMHPHDIQALIEGITKARSVAVLDNDYLNQRLAGGMT